MTTQWKVVALSLVVAAGLAGALAIGGCESVPLMAAPGTAMTLIANPTFVVSNGGSSVITAILVEPAGTFVPDGVEVFFFTNLGRLEPDTAKTKNGVARVNFVADSRSGMATITAISGGAPAPARERVAAAPATAPPPRATAARSIDITIGGALPKRLLVAASPARITSPRRSTIVATVYDEFGNPVQNVPVNFSIKSASPRLEETLDSGGAPRFTDSNGQAFDTLVTRAVVGSAQKTVVVTAAAPPALTADVTVFVD